MGSDTKKTTSFDSKSIAFDVLIKFGLVLSKTRNIVIADLRNRLIKNTSEEVNIENVITLIDNFFNLLGYDVESLIPEEVKEAVSEIFEVSEDLGNILREISNSLNEAPDLPQVLENGLDKNFYVIIKSLVENIIEMMKAFRKLGEIQFEKNAEQWNRFVKENYLGRDFPKRIFDHVVSVFMCNAFDVFSEDIEKIKDTLKERITDAAGELSEILDLLDTVLTDVGKGFEYNLKTGSKTLRELLRKILLLLEREMSPSIENIKNELVSLKSFIKIEEYFRRIYTVLDFMQVISLEKVEILSPSIDKDTVSLTTEIYVIHWNRFEEMVSNPIEYYKCRYPVRNYAEAEELMVQLIRVAQAFGLDIPDFGSLKRLLTDVLIKLEKWLKEAINASFGDEIRNIVGIIRNFLIMLEYITIKAKEEIKNNIDDILKQINQEINHIYKQALDDANKQAKKLGDEVGEITREFVRDIQLKAFPSKDDLIKTLKQILLPVFCEKASRYKELAKITEAEWTELIIKTADVFARFLDEKKTVLKKFSLQNLGEDIRNALLKELETQTEGIPVSLEELKNTVKNNPRNLSPEKLFSKFDIYAYFELIANAIKDKAEALNPEIYYDQFRSAAVLGLSNILSKGDDTALKFKNCVENQNAELLEKIFVSFLNDVLIDCWKELRRELLDGFLIPYIQIIKASAKAGCRKMLINLMQNLSEDISEIKENIEKVPDEYKDFVKEMFLVICQAIQDEIDTWQDGVKLAFKIGKPLYKLIDRIINKYTEDDKNAPKRKASDIIANIPELPQTKKAGNEELEFITDLPSYALDTNNKFLSVVLYDTREKEKSENFFAATLNIFIADRKKETDKETGIYIIPVIKGNYDKIFNAGEKHRFKLGVKAALNDSEIGDNKKIIEGFQKGAIGIFFSHKTFQWLDDTGVISALASVEFSRKEDAGPIEIIQSKYLDFSIKDYPQTLSLGFQKKDFFFGYKGEVKEGTVVLKIRQVNRFFAEILKEDIKSNFDLSLLYDTCDGFKFDGAASLKLNFNLNKKITHLFTLNALGLEIGSSDSSDGTLRSVINSSFTIDTQCVTFYVKDLGIGSNLNYLKADGSLGDFDLSPVFKFPSGMGVTIDASVVKGSGAILYDSHKEEFLGVLELAILEKIEVKALALLTMKMPDGGKGFSFIGLISVYFTPGIPLGMGFSLTGLGGSIGLNRSIDREVVQEGVRRGEIASVFFVKDIEKHFDAMLTQIGGYFPIRRNQFFFGVLARITFTEILHVEFGLFLQAPNPLQILIIGGLFVNLPTKEKALVKINVYFAGGIDFHEGMWFDASIVDSKIVQIQIYGDIAFRLNWGKNKGFLLSAGGFHPAYKPNAAYNVGSMRRLGMKLDYKILKLTFESYFAITSNTVQLGAAVDLRIGWKSVGIFGYFGFDCLFQFNPFRFLFDVRMSVEARWRRWKLLSINLEFSLSGPAQWNAKGKANFKILFFKFNVNFNISWGKSHSENEIGYISIYEIFSREYHNLKNWTAISFGLKDQQVRLIEHKPEESDFIVQPFDGIKFEQSHLPLDEQIVLERYGEGVRPKDYCSIQFSKIEIGKELFDDLSKTEYDFAPSLFFDLSEKEKLSRPSYEKMKNGVTIELGLKERAVSVAVDKEIEYLIEQDDIRIYRDAGEIYSSVSVEAIENLHRLVNDDNLVRLTPTEVYISTATTQEVDILDAFNNISHRSDSSFKRYVNRMQRIRNEMNRKKLDRFYEDTERKFAIADKGFKSLSEEQKFISLKKECELEMIKDYKLRRYKDVSQVINKLLAQKPELKDKIFVVKK